MPTLPVFAFLVVAATLAGFIDAAVGGGGLVTIPALLLGLPGQAWPVIAGTNKVVACTGTTIAAGQFLRAKALHWRELVGPGVRPRLRQGPARRRHTVAAEGLPVRLGPRR